MLSIQLIWCVLRVVIVDFFPRFCEQIKIIEAAVASASRSKYLLNLL